MPDLSLHLRHRRVAAAGQEGFRRLVAAAAGQKGGWETVTSDEYHPGTTGCRLQITQD